MRILLVEDEIGLAAALSQTLKSQKYVVMICHDGEEGLSEALTGSYDCILLDVMLPGKNGFELLEELRKNRIHTPVLMLTAKSDLSSRVEGLNLGADYYLTKPFATEELLACIRAITRRPEIIRDLDPEFEDLTLKSGRGELYCQKTGRSVKLGAKELLLMEELMANIGQILSKEILIEKIWGLESESEYNNIEVYVSFVRKKLAFIGSTVQIHATRGLGYSLEAQQ